MSHYQGKKFSRHHILQQKDPWEVARNAFEIALELALLGYIEEATRIFDLFESFSSGCKSSWSPGLYFAWEATGLWPESIPPAEKTPEAVQKLEIERIVWKRDSNATVDGLEKLMATATTGGKKDKYGNMQFRLDDLTAAIDLAVHIDQQTKATELLQIVADNFHVTWQALSRSRQVWRQLKEKALICAIGVNEEKLVALKNEAFETFSERLQRGPQRPLKSLPMKDLVNMCNENTLKNAVWEEMDVDPEHPPNTVLHPGATADEIALLEKKLGYELPGDIKEYLSVTNGMESLWNGFHGEPRLLGTEEIRVVDATEQQNTWKSSAVNVGHFMNMSIKVEWEPFNNCILVNDATDDSKYVWLLEPGYVQRAAVTYYETILKLPLDEQAHIQKLRGYLYAEADSTTQAVWLIVVWDPETYGLHTYFSWREYLEVLAGDTANEDILDEEDEEGRLIHGHDIIAYSLR
jgi:hypothetical protein